MKTCLGVYFPGHSVDAEHFLFWVDFFGLLELGV